MRWFCSFLNKHIRHNGKKFQTKRVFTNQFLHLVGRSSTLFSIIQYTLDTQEKELHKACARSQYFYNGPQSPYCIYTFNIDLSSESPKLLSTQRRKPAAALEPWCNTCFSKEIILTQGLSYGRVRMNITLSINVQFPPLLIKALSLWYIGIW